MKKNLLFFIPALVLAFFVFKKSFLAPITHDEALSYQVYSPKSVKGILAFKEDISANNHILNSLFLKGIRKMGFNQAGMLRLAASLSFLLFAWCLFQINKNPKSLGSMGFYLIACLNPYLLDFFSLARGYGISYGFMALALMLLLQGKNEANNKKLFWAMQVASLSLLANFNLVYFSVPFGLIHLFLFFQHNPIRFNSLIKLAGHYLFPALSVDYLYKAFNQLKAAQQLYFGGNKSFELDVVIDQLWCFIYDQNYSLNPTFLLIWKVLPVLLLGFALAFSLIKKIRQAPLFQDFAIAIIILFGAAVCIELNHYFLGSLYPIKRTGLFMSVLFFITLFLFFRLLASFKSLKIPVTVLAYSIIGLLSVHTYHAYDTLRFREIGYDSHLHEILAVLANETQGNTHELDISANWQFEPALNFYRETKNLNWLPKFNREPIRPKAKYLLVFDEDLPALNPDSLIELLTYPKDGVHLFKQVSK